ncbi:MAG: hypothetical protein N2510_07780 [Ignavibacteria bacterium]|nr:hypothetical protein [Ignavibacteria bacterium]
MSRIKTKKNVYSFLRKPAFIVSLLLIASVFTVLHFATNKDLSKQSPNEISQENEIIPPEKLNEKIDSVLYGFGIENSWINTTLSHRKDKNFLFEKNVIIPKDLSTLELNLEIGSVIHSAGFNPKVTEDILTKDIFISIEKGDTSGPPGTVATISVKYSDKISRNGAVISLLIEGIEEFNEKEIEKLIKDKQEFSYVLPRNLEKINILNQLSALKKDIVIKFQAGDEKNYENDFIWGSDEKKIREVIKNFTSDFTNIRNVLLIYGQNINRETLNNINYEFSRYNIKVISDSLQIKLLTLEEESSADKIKIISEKIRSISVTRKHFISLIKLKEKEFEKFYHEILLLKKLGHKFYPLAVYLKKLDENKRKDELKKTEESKMNQNSRDKITGKNKTKKDKKPQN